MASVTIRKTAAVERPFSLMFLTWTLSTEVIFVSHLPAEITRAWSLAATLREPPSCWHEQLRAYGKGEMSQHSSVKYRFHNQNFPSSVPRYTDWSVMITSKKLCIPFWFALLCCRLLFPNFYLKMKKKAGFAEGEIKGQSITTEQTCLSLKSCPFALMLAEIATSVLLTF